MYSSNILSVSRYPPNIWSVYNYITKIIHSYNQNYLYLYPYLKNYNERRYDKIIIHLYPFTPLQGRDWRRVKKNEEEMKKLKAGVWLGRTVEVPALKYCSINQTGSGIQILMIMIDWMGKHTVWPFESHFIWELG
jgi:hypothetical protein